MSIISFPKRLPSSIQWSLTTNTRKSVSPWTNTAQIQELDGVRFSASIAFNNLDAEETREFQAFLFACNGPVNSFYVEDPLFAAPLITSPLVLPTVNTIGIDQKKLHTTGWPNNYVIKAGTYIDVDGSFRAVTQETVGQSLGTTILHLSHRLYKEPALNSIVNYINPKCRMRLVDDKQFKRRTTPPFKSSFTIKVEEVINL